MIQTHEQRISLCHIIFFLQELARKLRPSTLRAKFGKTKVQNAVHCTDLPEDGLLEVILNFFCKVIRQRNKSGFHNQSVLLRLNLFSYHDMFWSSWDHFCCADG
jgi:hypothetical protein